MPTALHRRILGPHWSIPPPSEAGQFFEAAHVHTAARRTLWQQLTSSGSWQTGYLFGQITDDVLQIMAATPAAYPGYDAQLLALGFLDALRRTGDPVDWVGIWWSAPNGQLPDLADSLHRFGTGQRTAEFADQRVLLSLGLQDGRLAFTALRSVDIGAASHLLPVTPIR